jgi:hypothetical protein
MMKKYLKIAILMLTVAFFAVSCQEEEHSSMINPEALNASSELTNRLGQVTIADVVVPDDNVLDSTNCFKIKLPVEVTVNGQELLILDQDGYDTVHDIFTASNTDNDHIEIGFPITIIYPNQEELMVGNQQQFGLLQGNCPTLGINDCVQLLYPVSVSAYNTDFQQQLTYTFNNDDEVHEFLVNLNPADTYTINYPIGIVLEGETITVNNNAQLLDSIVEALANCGDSPNPCANPNILTDGLIMYIPFGNQVTDLTGYGNPLPADAQYSFVTDRNGHPNGAFSFNTGSGTNIIQIAANDNNNLLQASGFSISFWFNRQNIDPTEFEQLYNNDQLEISLGNQINPEIRSPFVVASGMIDPIYDTGWIQDLTTEINQWHHIVITYNGEVLYLYRDGILQSGSSTVEFDGTMMGGGTFGNNFKGYIDDIRMYNRALSNNEINILHQLEGDVNTCLN